LLLSLVLGLPRSFSVEELEEANERYLVSLQAGNCWYQRGRTEWANFDDKISDRVLFYYNLSAVFLSVSLFVTVLVFTFPSSHDFENDKKGFAAW
jgi:hypothetical protein